MIPLFFALLMAWFQTPTPSEPVEPLEVVIEGVDGLDLHASFYAGQSGKTVLLLHQLYTTRQSWATLTPFLLENGYNVLIPTCAGTVKRAGIFNGTKHAKTRACGWNGCASSPLLTPARSPSWGVAWAQISPSSDAMRTTSRTSIAGV
ncbi:MAG UNVERIFIED_CONTAM: hypothetical protein LVT10_18405 [Anaerolineae bacterium]